MDFFSNRPVPEKIRERAERELGGDRAVFAIVGDMDLGGKYNESAMYFTERAILAFDKDLPGGFRRVDFSDLEKTEVKRMYGNALFRVRMKEGGMQDILRFTFSAADIADVAAIYVNTVIEDGFSEEPVEMVYAAYMKQRSFCPKCGRKLPSPEAECINCGGKKKLLSKFAKYVYPARGRLIVCIFLSVFTTAMSLVPPYTTKILVDDVIPGAVNGAEAALHRLALVLCVLLGAYLLQYGVAAVRGYILRCAGDQIVIDLKKDIYYKAQYLPLSFYDKTSTGSVINRVNSDTSTLQAFILRITQEAVVKFFLMIGLAVIMFTMDWRLTLFSFVTIPAVALIGRFFGKRISPKYMRLWRKSSAISTLLADTIPGVRVVKAFTNEEAASAKFSRYCDSWMAEDRKAAATASIFPNIMTFLVSCGTVIIYAVGGGEIIRGQGGLTLGMLVAFVNYAGMFYEPVNFFANLSDSYQNTLASAEKIMDILDAEPESNFGKGKTSDKMDGKIEFKNVNFSFDHSKKVLDNINLTIEPGDIVGIVGTTGSGKSTLINLIMRYYDDYDGEILVDGKNIKDIDMGWYRSQIGFVQQDPMMFRDTVFKNIAYGTPNAHVEQVINAAEIANAHTFIEKLPDAYDTMLGERGVGLSGGERQRVSIARAVMKNPGILIFDEATAAVDSETENLIQTAIERLIRGRTTLMIAHRLSTLRKANKIVVVDKGRIVECGAPDELLKLKGKYYKLVQIQSMNDELISKKREENFE
ncbi:MAG: ATP-binding cassette domain-containing protein [Clostridia bacterium]|nr:ATP-binding cassette domain-containing protein [Clostridia bacterium]